MTVLCLNVCRLYVPNIVSLGIHVCFEKLHLIKVGTFAWYSVKVRVIFGVQFERRKGDKKSKPTGKTETCKLYSRAFWIFLPNVIEIDPYNFELYRFKVGAFFLRHSADAEWLLILAIVTTKLNCQRIVQINYLLKFTEMQSNYCKEAYFFRALALEKAASSAYP